MNKLTSQDKQKLDHYNGMSVGQIMSRARMDLNASIHDAANHLNIASGQLEAIEADDIASLPPKVYAVGFVRAYADLLGLDSEKMAYLFKVQFYGKGQVEHDKKMVRADGASVSMQEAVFQKENAIPFITAIFGGGAVGVAVLLFLLIWVFMPSDKAGQITVPEAPGELSEDDINKAQNFVQGEGRKNDSSEPAEPMDSIVKPENGGKAYGGTPLTSPLAFKIQKESWIEIRSIKAGKVILSKTLKIGDVFYVSEGDDILFTTGNAGGIEAFIDGQSLGYLGAVSEIIRARPFSVEALRLRQQN